MSTFRNDSIAVHRVAVLRPFVLFLSTIGAPVNRWLQKAGIPEDVFEGSNHYIPSVRFYKFVINASRDSGIQDLGFQVGSAFGPTGVDPRLKHGLNQSPTLYAGLLAASDLMNRSVTNTRIGVTRSQDGKHTLVFHRPSCELQNLAVEQIAPFGFTTLLEIIRLFAGAEWRPSEMGLMTPKTPHGVIPEAFPGARIRTSPLYSYIMLDDELLSLPPVHRYDIGRTPSFLEDDAFAKDIVASLKQVVHAYLKEPGLGLNQVAELFNTSPRTLQRKLAEAGASYSEVLEQARLEAACGMLEKPDCTVTHVSYFLGYSDPTNFARAFRRVAGVSPKEYHRQRTRRG